MTQGYVMNVAKAYAEAYHEFRNWPTDRYERRLNNAQHELLKVFTELGVAKEEE